MDSERGSKPINKLGCSSSTEKGIHGPFHSDHCLNGISWRDINNATSSEVELENIIDSNESVLSTLGLHDCSLWLGYIIPCICLYHFSIHVDCSRLSSWVRNSDGRSSLSWLTSGLQRSYCEFQLFSWGSSHVYVVDRSRIGLNQRRESLKSKLSWVESIPNMVHHSIEVVLHSCSFFLDVNWLHWAIPIIIIITLKE